MSLRDEIETAAVALDRYKTPDVSEIKDKLDALLVAGKLGSIQHDRLESLSVYENHLNIVTNYSVRGCFQCAEYTLPMSVITADDPLDAVKVWAKAQRVEAAKNEVRAAERNLEWAKAHLLKVEQED